MRRNQGFSVTIYVGHFVGTMHETASDLKYSMHTPPLSLTYFSTCCFHHTSLHYNTHSLTTQYPPSPLHKHTPPPHILSHPFTTHELHTPFHNTHTLPPPHVQPTVQPNHLSSIFTLNSATGQLVVDGRGPGLDANGSIGTITVCVHTHDSLNLTHCGTY